MCAIIGIFGREFAEKYAKLGLKAMAYRGRDCSRVVRIGVRIGKSGQNALGHALHSVVGYVPQPLIDKKAGKAGKNLYFVANCEIYNWKELCKKHNIRARNDAELLFRLMVLKGCSETFNKTFDETLNKTFDETFDETLSEIDGVYSFAFYDSKEQVLFLARDILGIKPLWCSFTDGAAFASEKKALESIGNYDVEELNPRKILKISFEDNAPGKKVEFINRKFFSTEPELPKSEQAIMGKLKSLLSDAVRKRIPIKRFGLLFSGGIDAAVLAKMLAEFSKKLKGDNAKPDFICYTAGFRTARHKNDALHTPHTLPDDIKSLPDDIKYARLAAKKMGLKLKTVLISEREAEKMLKTVIPLIEDNNPVKAGVALTFFAACRQARKDGCKVIFSGLGSDELFAGYNRFKSTPTGKINSECLSSLLKLYERDTYRDDVVTMYNNLELRLPFLDKEVVEYAIRIPEEFKLKGMREGIDKIEDKAILRRLGTELGIPEEVAGRKKKAAQYGSNADKIIEKLARKKGFKSRSDYLLSLYKTHNVKLAALISTGKDSLFALHIMQRQNYKISCVVAVMSKNLDSYMFHTPNIHLVKLQAEAMGLPLVLVETEGEKENELEDLKSALKLAKAEYGAEGIVTGALYSSYQRDRIEKLADSIGMKIFSPLWHIDPESEMRELLRNGFKIVLSSIAAYGLDKSWLGRELTGKDVDALVGLNTKFGINVAGEGGEYESLVLDCPMFKKRITIKKAHIAEEKEFAARMIVDEAVLTEKN